MNLIPSNSTGLEKKYQLEILNNADEIKLIDSNNK